MRALNMAVVAICIAGAPLVAQRPAIAPGVDLLIGSGPHSTRAGATYYRDEDSPLAELRVFARFGHGRVRPMVAVDRTAVPIAGGRLTNCPLAPNGTCEEYFPPLAGYDIGVGASAVLMPRVSVGVTAGYSALRGAGRFLDLDASVGVLHHVRATAGMRQLVFLLDGHEAWWRPATFGVRIE